VAILFPNLILILLGFCPLYAETWSERAGDWIALELFHSPRQREEVEILARTQEHLQDELRLVRQKLKKSLVEEKLYLKPKELDAFLEEENRVIGLLVLQNQEKVYQYGDFSYFYEDGFSYRKLQLEGKVPYVEFNGFKAYFLLGNYGFRTLADFSLVGFSTRFYAFGDHGDLRYTNDWEFDRSIRLDSFRKAFANAKQKYPLASEKKTPGLVVFLFPEPSSPLLYLKGFLRFFLILAFAFWFVKLWQWQYQEKTVASRGSQGNLEEKKPW